MKPSFTPCFFSNSSLYWLRICITAPMSTSLNVVSIAAVFCASFSRRAMVWRSLVILHPLFAGRVVGRRGRARLDGRGAGAGGAAAPAAIAASMSPLVTRPPLPVPGSAPGRCRFRPRGARPPGRAPWPRLPAASAGAAAARGRRRRRRRRPWRRPSALALPGAAAAAAAAAPPSVIEPSTRAGRRPSRRPWRRSSPSMPAAGALTSSVTLSVSSSTSGSSALTASPGFLNQRPMVASETDSPRVGTRISVAMIVCSSLGRTLPDVTRRLDGANALLSGFRPRTPRPGRPAAAPGASTSGRSAVAAEAGAADIARPARPSSPRVFSTHSR